MSASGNVRERTWGGRRGQNIIQELLLRGKRDRTSEKSKVRCPQCGCIKSFTVRVRRVDLFTHSEAGDDHGAGLERATGVETPHGTTETAQGIHAPHTHDTGGAKVREYRLQNGVVVTTTAGYRNAMWKSRRKVDTGGLTEDDVDVDLSWDDATRGWSQNVLGARSFSSTPVTKKFVADVADVTSTHLLPFVKNLVEANGGDPDTVEFPKTYRDVETTASAEEGGSRLGAKQVGLCMGPMDNAECFLFFNDGDLMNNVNHCPKCGTRR